MSPRTFLLLAVVLLGCPGEPEPEYPSDYTLEVAITEADEDAGAVAEVATVTLDEPAVDPVEVYVSTSDASQLAPSGGATLEPGKTKITFGLAVSDDSLIEADRTYAVYVDALGLTRTFDFTVVDDEPRTVTLSGPASLDEGAVSVQIHLEAASTVGEAVSFDLSVEPPEALVLPPTAVLNAGSQQGSFTVGVPDNAVLDLGRAVTISAEPDRLLETPDPLTVTILDDEPATLDLEALVAGLSEGDGEVSAAARVTVAAPLAADLEVTLASDRTDLLQVPSSVTVLAGATSADIAVTAVDDDTLDLQEFVQVTASADAFTSDHCYLSITDDDIANFQLDVGATTVSEADGTLVGWASVSTGATLSYDLEVVLHSTDTSELTVPATVEIPSGSDEVGFTVTVVDDSWLDFDQTVDLSATTSLWFDNLQILVQDDEPNALTVLVEDVEVWESDGPSSDVVSVQTAAPVESALTVDVESKDVGELQVQLQVTVLAGSTSADVGIYPIDDDVPDLDQEVTISATAPGCTQGQGVVVVLDEDTGYVVELRQGPDVEQWIDFGAFPGLMYDSDWAFAEKFMIPVDPQAVGYQFFRGNAFQDGEGDFSVNVRTEPDPQVSLTFLPMTMSAGQAGVTLAEGQWHTLVVQYDHADSTAYLYVDGVMVDSDPKGAWDDRDNLHRLVWGGQWCDPGYYMCVEYELGDVYLESDATLAHMAIWQRLLDPAEIAAYDGAVDLADPALVFSTAIGDGVVYDAVGTHPGTVHGDPLFYRP